MSLADDAVRWRTLYDLHERQGPARVGEARVHLPGRIRTLPDNGSAYWIDWNDFPGAGLSGARIDEVLAEERAHGRALGREFEWKLYHHDEPVDLRERLEAAGYEPQEAEALVIAPIATVLSRLADRGVLTDDGGDVALPEGATIVRPSADDLSALDAVATVYRKVYDDAFPQFISRMAVELVEAPDAIDVVVLMLDGEPASVGWTWIRGADSPFATLWGGSTVPEARGRGLYQRMLAARLLKARERGRELASLDAGPMSRPILERLGFVTVGWTTPCVARPA